MMGRPFGEYLGIARFGLIVILIVTIGRWALSLSGVPYFPRGSVVFSLVPASYFLAICYGAMTPKLYGLSWSQALVPVVIILLFTQILIFSSTIISYSAGMETYFNHPEALGATEKISAGAAYVERSKALVINVIAGCVIALLGQVLGKALPPRTR